MRRRIGRSLSRRTAKGRWWKSCSRDRLTQFIVRASSVARAVLIVIHHVARARRSAILFIAIIIEFTQPATTRLLVVPIEVIIVALPPRPKTFTEGSGHDASQHYADHTQCKLNQGHPPWHGRVGLFAL